MMRRPPRSTLFPYTPLSRSRRHAAELASRAPGDLRQSAEVGIEGRRTLGPRLEQHDPEGLDPGGNEDELRLGEKRPRRRGRNAPEQMNPVGAFRPGPYFIGKNRVAGGSGEDEVPAQGRRPLERREGDVLPLVRVEPSHDDGK